MRSAVIILLILAPPLAGADSDITWLMPELPPLSIKVDGAPSNGVTDLQMKYITSKLPRTQNFFIFANPDRMWYMMDNGSHNCLASAIYTKDRSKHYSYTLTGIRTPPMLIVSGEVLSRVELNNNGEVDLEKLLANKNLNGLVPKQRSYGGFVDHIIQTRPNDSNLRITTQANFGENIFGMITAHRTDYSLMFDFEIAYLKTVKNERIDAVKILPIQGNNQLLYSGIVCPGNEWGKETIKKIEAIVGTTEGAAVMRQAMENWATYESTIKFKAEMDRFYRLREKPIDMSKF
jgi:uncharacterized protein (TIGR02285 family)